MGGFICVSSVILWVRSEFIRVKEYVVVPKERRMKGRCSGVTGVLYRVGNGDKFYVMIRDLNG